MRFTSLRPRVTATVAAASLLAVAVPSAANAEDLLGLYLGGAVGQGNVKVDSGNLTVDSFKENHSAYKAMVGIRPIAPVGVEVEYFDLGHPNSTLGGAPADASVKGAAAFAVGYIPLPFVAIFGKAGLARMQSSVSGTQQVGGSTCPSGAECLIANGLFSLKRTDTSAAFGVGAQFKLGAWAVRGEVERFSAHGADPLLATVGFTWTFL